MKTLTLLVGIPGSGKSTWRKANVAEGTVITSSDDVIELIAADRGKTYDDVYADAIDQASSLTKTMFRAALSVGMDIVVDRTNLTPKSRAPWIREARTAGYTVNAVVFKRPETQAEHDEWNRRLDRPGKTIPNHVLVDMYCSLKAPLPAENVNDVTFVDSYES